MLGEGRAQPSKRLLSFFDTEFPSGWPPVLFIFSRLILSCYKQRRILFFMLLLDPPGYLQQKSQQYANCSTKMP